MMNSHTVAATCAIQMMKAQLAKYNDLKIHLPGTVFLNNLVAYHLMLLYVNHGNMIILLN